MSDINETTTVRTYYDENGLPVARITATRDDERAWNEKPGEYVHTNATVVVVSAGYDIDTSQIEDTQVDNRGTLHDAWERFEGVAMSHAEHAELMTRYLNAFHPLTPYARRIIQTGYSQGDWVDVLAWIEPDRIIHTGNGPRAYQVATANHQMIEDHFKSMQAVARGQFWDVALEFPIIHAEMDDGQDTATVTIEWNDTDECISTLCMEEFDPWAECIEVGEYSFDIPGHASHVDA